MPKLIVVMAARNASSTIENAIRSTLRAMPKDSALVVRDDGSTDNTSEAATRVNDARLIVTRSELSLGSGPARQAVIDDTDSELVANVDADDYCFPWRFSRHAFRPEYDVCFSAAVDYRSLRRIRFSSTLPLTPSETVAALLIHNPFFHSTMIARREALNLAGGYRPIRFAQDYDLWLRLASNDLRISRSPIPSVAYRRSPNQVSNRPEYAATIRADQGLTAAHLQLVWKVATRRHKDLLSQLGNGPDAPWDTISRGFECMVGREIIGMRPIAKAYYRKLVNRQGSSWRDPRWTI